MYSVTMTIKQLATLRLMLRLQKVRSIRKGLHAFKEGAPEVVVLSRFLQTDDMIANIDLPLMRVERTVLDGRTGVDSRTLVDVILEDDHLEFCKKTVNFPYSADGTLGSQAEQGAVLHVIKEEAEGLRLALGTATAGVKLAGVTPIFQALPKGRQ